MVRSWLGDGLIMNIPRFESYVHALGLSFQKYVTISHNPFKLSIKAENGFASMDKFDHVICCARVFSRPAAILKAEKTLGTRLTIQAKGRLERKF